MGTAFAKVRRKSRSRRGRELKVKQNLILTQAREHQRRLMPKTTNNGFFFSDRVQAEKKPDGVVAHAEIVAQICVRAFEYVISLRTL